MRSKMKLFTKVINGLKAVTCKVHKENAYVFLNKNYCYLPRFLRAITIEALPHRLSDELLKTAPIESTNSKKFETNLKKSQKLLT